MKKTLSFCSFLTVLVFVLAVQRTTAYAASLEKKTPAFDKLQQRAFEESVAKKFANQMPKEDIKLPAERTKELYGVEPSPELSKKLHLEEKTSSSLSLGNGNNLPWTLFDYGDIALARDDSCSYSGYPCYWAHAAMFDKDWDIPGSEDAFAFWSAYPNGGAPSDNSKSRYSVNDKVGLQSKRSIHNYSYAVGIWVPDLTHDQYVAVTWSAYYQRGEPYKFYSSKSSDTSWYCSKLPYVAYLVNTGKNLDKDGSYWVFPDDIYGDNDTLIFAYGN